MKRIWFLLVLGGLSLISCSDSVLQNPFDPQAPNFDGGGPSAVTILPPGGEDDSTILVTLKEASGNTVYYTTDGSEPTTSEILRYSGPIPLSTSSVVKAIAVKPGYPPSPVTSATFTIRCLPVELGSVASPMTPTDPIFLSCPTSEATIRYTTDGSDPVTSGLSYPTTGILLKGSSTIRAVAVKPGLAPSEEMAKSFTVLTLVESWEFDTSLEGWMKPGDNFQVSSWAWNLAGAGEGVVVGTDPRVYSPTGLALPLGDVVLVEIRMKNATPGIQGSLYWATTTQTWNAGSSINFPVVPNSDYTVYRIDVSSKTTFTGTLVQWRLDPENNAKTGGFSLDFFRVYALKP